jgi:Beta-lactamase enzyme family
MPLLDSRLAVTLALCWVVSSRAPAADDPPRLDRDEAERSVRAIIEEHGGRARVGIWVGGPTGDASYAKGPDETLPTASAIKTAILIELFARFAGELDRPPAGLDAILRDDHPAIAHFAPKQRDEVRKSLDGVTVRRLGGIMMGSVDASNIVYNAAANVAIALLGGPAEATRSIRGRDPAFAPIAVRRYMLADRKATGDNEATAEALAAVLQRLASRRISRIAEATVDDIRRAVLAKDDPRRGRVFVKDGDLASDPITCVRSGWAEKPGGSTIVFVVMLARDRPKSRTADEAHRDLAATAARLAESLLDAAVAPASRAPR